MKNLVLSGILGVLFVQLAQAQCQTNAANLIISPGSYLIALDGVVNTNGSTFTVGGTLTTPADLVNTTGATLQGNGQYNIGGNWTNSANFIAGTSTVTFDGAQNSTATSGGNAFYLLVLNKAGGNDLVLADPMHVLNTIDFQAANNHVILGDFNLQAGNLLGYEASRYVRTTGAGFLVRNVGAFPVDFPVGNTTYNPATLTNAGSPDFYLVRVADAVLSGGGTGAPIGVNAVGRGWFVEENTAGGSDLSLALQWNASDEPASFDRSQAYISHFITGSWDTQPVASASGTNPYTLNRSGITNLSPFAVFDGDFMPVINISGIILWEHDGLSGVKNTTVNLSGDATDNHLTPVDGTYTLTATNGSNFTITPTKNINKLNGITVADATAIQQHITGINPITNPYKQVAADVNKSNSISTLDATIINQSLLGNPAALAQFKTSWRFVPVDHNLSIPPWGFPEKIDLNGVNASVPGQDFWGVKTGDVIDVHANPANLAPRTPLVLRTNDQPLEAGQILNVTLYSDQFDDLAAWQFALHFDPERLALISVEPAGEIPVTAEHFGLFNRSIGEIRAVWSQAEGIFLQDAMPVFILKFNVLKSGGQLHEALGLDEATLPAYAYNSTLEESGLRLVYDQTSSVVDAGKKALDFEIWPNPVVNQATVQLELPEACTAQLRILDVSGRKVFQVERLFPAGTHLETLEFYGLPAGVWYCELLSPFGLQTKKVTKIGK